MTILVFPSSLEASRDYASQAKRQNLKVVGASSINDDPYIQDYPAWEPLPFISDTHFEDSLSAVITKHNITAIYTPHAPSFLHLNRLNLPVEILGESPCDQQMARVRTAFNLGNQDSFKAGLLEQANHLYGECPAEKITAFTQVFEDCPAGDVVEVGVFFGKSALILNRLAQHHQIGATLAIDPWDCEISIQHDSPQLVQDLSHQWDWDLVFKGFLLQAQGCHAGRFNYLKATSVNAWEDYRHSRIMSSPEFGDTLYSGKIAVLHLDGNHDERYIQQDFDLWSSAVVPGGWIILDDYNWSLGDGPKIVGDKVLQHWQDRIESHFVAGGALFIKTRD